MYRSTLASSAKVRIFAIGIRCVCFRSPGVEFSEFDSVSDQSIGFPNTDTGCVLMDETDRTILSLLCDQSSAGIKKTPLLVTRTIQLRNHCPPQHSGSQI